MIVKINPQNPQERLLRKAVEVLTGGGIIAVPWANLSASSVPT